MSTLSIVAITVFIVVFVLIMLAFSVYLTYAGIQLRRTLDQTASQIPLLISTLGDTLKSQSALLENQIASLDGQKLIEAARANLITCKRIETACIAFSDTVRTLVSEDYVDWKAEVAAANNGTGNRLQPDAYAPTDPTGQPHITRSVVTSGDYAAMARQDEESTTTS